MDTLDILETMAANASYEENAIDDLTVERWQKLFGYTAEEASKKIEEQRDDLTAIISESLWYAVSEQQIPLGHDRETYSHWLRLRRQVSTDPSSMSSAASGHKRATDSGHARIGQDFLLRLEGPISTTAQVAEIAKLASTPQLFEGASEDTTTDVLDTIQFCKVDGAARQAIIAWLNEHHPTLQPLFVMRSLSRKEFDTASISPTLGHDATFPQYRLGQCDALPRPAQGEYPIWYFFYGTLACQQKLHTLFQHIDGEDYDLANYQLRSARVSGGKLTTWGNKYKALVDREEDDVVEGSAFLVLSELHEEALRSYETSAYEVVRCWIKFIDGNEQIEKYGCTFRLIKS